MCHGFMTLKQDKLSDKKMFEEVTCKKTLIVSKKMLMLTNVYINVLFSVWLLHAKGRRGPS